METELSAPSTRREARADASAGHVRQLSAGISAASMSELLPKTSHTRSQSQTSNDSCATFVVNNVPEYAPENDGVEGPASFTDSDSVRFTAAADGIIDDWEGLEQGRVNSLYPMRYMRKRAVQEWNLLSRQWRMYVTVRVSVSCTTANCVRVDLRSIYKEVFDQCITINIYGGSMLFRNLAFYRYRPGERLTQDIGFDIFPEAKGWLTGFPMLVLQITCLGACALSFYPRSTPAPYAVNIIRRWGMVEALGSILRFFTYISTTLPGAADHCVPSKNPHIERDQPKTFSDIFFMLKVDGIGLEENSGASGTYNCGDLVFSGHMLMTIDYAFTALRYAPTSFMMTPRFVRIVFRPLVWLMVVMQGIGIIMARNHYTMDVVVASYTTPLLWYWYITYLEPEDMKPTFG